MIYNQGGQLDMEIQRAILLDCGEIPTDVLEEDLVRATEFAARTLGGWLTGWPGKSMWLHVLTVLQAMLRVKMTRVTKQSTLAILDRWSDPFARSKWLFSWHESSGAIGHPERYWTALLVTWASQLSVAQFVVAGCAHIHLVSLIFLSQRLAYKTEVLTWTFVKDTKCTVFLFYFAQKWSSSFLCSLFAAKSCGLFSLWQI